MYTRGQLRRSELDSDPLRQLALWIEEAKAADLCEPTAMVLATVGRTGKPSTRTVLLKEIDETGLIFYTNLNSRKSREIQCNSAVAITLLWTPLERQVVINGIAAPLARSKVHDYFATRSQESQQAATVAQWPGSAIKDRSRLDQLFSNATVDGCPDHWGGFHVQPQDIEFWQGRPHRLHDRFVYRNGCIERLVP